MRELIAVAIVVLCTSTGYWAGDHNRNNAWLAKQGESQRAAKEELKVAQAHGDALSHKLLQQQEQIIQLKEEKANAIAHSTTGRACLGNATLRVLNQTPGIRISGLPTAPISTIAADEAVATDTSIALWISDAGAQYETCRARLDALIDWHER